MTPEELREYVELRDGGAQAAWTFDQYRHEYTCRIGGRIFVSHELPHKSEMRASFKAAQMAQEAALANEANSRRARERANASYRAQLAALATASTLGACSTAGRQDHKLGGDESRRLFEPMFDSAGARLYRARHTPNALWLITSLAFLAVGVLAL